MAGSTPPVSFGQFLQADREKKKRETLASRILGKGRRDSAPAGGNVGFRKATSNSAPSLASRIGVNKRPPPGRNTQASRNAGRLAIPRTTSASVVERGNRIYSHMRSEQPNGTDTQFNFHDHTEDVSPGLSIRGAAGPCTVVASNFAPGTTASDISRVMEPVGGEIIACRLVSSNPTVICEMTFKDKSGAEDVVKMFNNRKADNRLLYVFFKDSPQDTAPRGERVVEQMAVDYEPQGRRAPPQYQDGRYGFGEARREKGLVSDSVARRGRSSRR